MFNCAISTFQETFAYKLLLTKSQIFKTNIFLGQNHFTLHVTECEMVTYHSFVDGLHLSLQNARRHREGKQQFRIDTTVAIL